jgi:hypothetical protein
MHIQFQPQTDEGLVRAGVDTVEIELTRLIHRGRRNWVFEGTIGNERCAVKIPQIGGKGVCTIWEEQGSEYFIRTSVDSDLYSGSTGCNWIARQLLTSEYKTIKYAGNEWNSGAMGLGFWSLDDFYGDKLAPFESLMSRLCMVLPYFAEATLAQISPPERNRVWLGCLPSLWTALTACAHGDLNPRNILVAADGTFFRLIDPCSACAVESLLNEHWTRTVHFVTTPAFYPLYDPSPSLGERGSFLKQLQAKAEKRRLADFELTEDGKRGSAAVPLSSRDRVNPSPADQCAMGLITHQLLTQQTLIVPELLEEPAWVENWRTPRFPRRKLDYVLESFSRGYLREKLATLNNRRIARLIEGLVTLEVSGRSEIEELLYG